MNRILFGALFLVFFAVCHAQPAPVRGEFATNSNGLMYSDNDMKSLRFIVDSLNLRFKTCDLNKTYYATCQATTHYISFSSKTNDLTAIINDLKKNISFDELSKKYASFAVDSEKSKLIIKLNDGTYLTGSPGKGYDDITLSDDSAFNYSIIAGQWVYYYSKPDSYSKDYDLDCHYFPSDWQNPAIPTEYARLIQYVDCMIDTSAHVFLTENYISGWSFGEKEDGYYNLGILSKYINKKMEVQNRPDSVALSDEQVIFATYNLKDDDIFKQLLARTIDDYFNNKTGNAQLAHIAMELGLYDKALLMKRCYQVMGYCSQDSRPREHARDIAILAAQSHSWDIFLRSHMDIMNDRMPRAIDASYAWGNRKTYLKELEELNLNIVDLMLGMTLRASNVSDNHYQGTIWRLGWALTESKEKNLFESKALAMMKDNNLDEFNRGLIFLLYKSYFDRLEEKESIAKIKALKKDIASFPGFIQSSIKELKTEKQKGD